MDQIIRRAVQRDIPRLIELGEEFALLSQSVHGFEVSRESIIQFTNHVVNEADGVVFVLEVDGVIQGFIAGLVQKIYFSKDIALQEVAWYVKKGFKGLSLLYAFEKCAKDVGCNHLVVGNKPQYCDLKRVYERMGFHLLENQYAKRLG